MSDFYSTLIANGFNPKEVIPDGRFRRCSTTDKPRKKNGVYVMHVSGRRGYFHNYAIDDKWHEWSDGKPISVIERKKVDEDILRFRKAEAARKKAATSSMASHFNSLSKLSFEHEYLARKNLTMQGCFGCRVDGDMLVVPAYKSGFLATFQTIKPDGEKKYRYGCSVSGASYDMVRKNASITCVVEGFATGLAVYQSVPEANVIVAFDAGNLIRVVSEKNIKGMCVICADNDWETEDRIGVNTGIHKALEAAKTIGCDIAYPLGIKGSDWADALLEWGDIAKAKIRMEIMRKVKYVY